MARSKKYVAKNETHSKTTLNSQNPKAVKKNGAGKGNWGKPGEDFSAPVKNTNKQNLKA